MPNWTVWNKTDYLYEMGLALNNLQILYAINPTKNKLNFTGESVCFHYMDYLFDSGSWRQIRV